MTRAQMKKRLRDSINALVQAASDVDEVAAEIQEYYDGKSEKWQEGEKGAEYQGWIDLLEEAADSAREAQEKLEEVSGD